MPPSKKYPRRDFKAMSELLQSMGIMNYGRQVLPFMIEFTHNYVNSVLDEADQLAMRSNKKMFDVSDVRNAMKNVREKLYYKEPVPMKAAVGKNSNSSVKNLKPEPCSSIIGNWNSSQTPLVPVPSTSEMGNCAYTVLNEANDTETSSDEELVVSSHVKAIKNKRNNKPYKRPPVKKKVTTANSHLTEEVNENKPTLTTIDSIDYPVTSTALSTSPVEDNERSLTDEVNESSTRSGEKALGISSVQKETKPEGDKLEAGSPTKKRITRTRCRQRTEITKPKPLPTSSTSEVDSNTQSSILPSTSCAENSSLDETSESGTSCSNKASDISSVCKSTKNKRNELEVQGPAKKKLTRAGSSSKSEANEPKPLLASSTVEVDSKSQSSVVAVPSTSSAHDDVHKEANGLAMDCDKKTLSVSGVKRKARTQKNKSNNEESQPVEKITKTSSQETAGRYKPKPITPSSMFKVDPIPVAKVTKTYSRKPTGRNKPKSFLLPSIFEAAKISENSAITLPATSCIDLAHTISDESNKLTINAKKKPNSPVRRTTTNNRSNVCNKKSPSKEGTKAPLTVRNKRKTPPLSSIKKDDDSDVQGPVAKMSSISHKVIGLEDYVHSVMSEEVGSTSNHNKKAAGVLSPQKRTKTQKIKVEPGSNSQSAASTAPPAGYGGSILKLLEMYEAEENKNKGVKVEKDDATEVSSANVNDMKSPIIVRIKQEVVEDDDYDKN